MSVRAVDATWTGRVQGVGFRMSVQAAAASTGVGGWVRNRTDGSVEAVLLGTPDALDAFRPALAAALARGPARVDRADWSERAPRDGERDGAANEPFRIRR